MKIKLERLKCETCDGGGEVGHYRNSPHFMDWEACPKCNRSGVDGYRISDETLETTIKVLKQFSATKAYLEQYQELIEKDCNAALALLVED